MVATTAAAGCIGALIFCGLPFRLLESQADSVAHRLDSVVVTVTRGTGRSILDSPFAVTIARPDSTRPGQRHAAIDETLALIPGLTITSRNNPSQDARVSIRGFGARSAFGVRGIRVLRDGMPLTLPDGQTPLDYLSLESVGSVEVMRGSASALYGNAGGGVIDIQSATPAEENLFVDARLWLGAKRSSRGVIAASGRTGRTTYVADAVRSEGDGERDHSRHRSTSGFLHATTRFGRTHVSLTALALDNPLALNPGALTHDELRANTSSADALAVRRNARKVVKQIQAGLSAMRAIGNGNATISAFGGARSLDNPLTFSVVDVARRSYGVSGVASQQFTTLGRKNDVTTGFDVQYQNDSRRNFTACADTVRSLVATASCPLPTSDRGSVTLNQRELISSAGVFVSDKVRLSRTASISGAVRIDRLRFEVDDRLIGSSNPDDSGDRLLGAASPILGLLIRAAPTHSAYANLSFAFETPTATELGNKPNGTAGINAELDPQRSRTAEVGLKGFAGSVFRYDVALFATTVRDELVPFEIQDSNGRRYFRNAGRTIRKGAEAGTALAAGPASLSLTYSFSDFRFKSYQSGSVDYSGNFIPGVARHRLQSALTLSRQNFFAVLENETASQPFTDDSNLTRAPSYSVSHFRVGLKAPSPTHRLSVTAGVLNMLDRRYASSLAVNAARGKFYEPAPRRNLFLGVSAGVIAIR